MPTSKNTNPLQTASNWLPFLFFIFLFKNVQNVTQTTEKKNIQSKSEPN